MVLHPSQNQVLLRGSWHNQDLAASSFVEFADKWCTCPDTGHAFLKCAVSLVPSMWWTLDLFTYDDNCFFLPSPVFFVQCVKNVNVKIVDGVPEAGGQ